MNNPFDFFDKIFYINLDHRLDRRQFMENQFKKFNIKAERFNAINLTKEQNEDMLNRGCNFYDHTRPEYAPRIKSCTMSHLTVLLQSKIMDYENILILEDDALLDENIIEDLSKCIDDLKNYEWDMFYLGCNPLEYYKETETLGRIIRTTTNHAYAINKRFFDYILVNSNFFKNYPCIDGYYGNLGINKNIKIYMSLKNIVTQVENFSDIENNYVNYTPIINERYSSNIIEKPKEW